MTVGEMGEAKEIMEVEQLEQHVFAQLSQNKPTVDLKIKLFNLSFNFHLLNTGLILPSLSPYWKPEGTKTCIPW